MDDAEVPFAAHITRRGLVYQYVRRVPDDIRDAFPVSRIQRSLRTREKGQAFATAASVHAEIERRFAAARRTKGVTLHVIPIDGWEWPDWQALADWFRATLLEEDWQARLRGVSGAAFSEGVDRSQLWRDTPTVRAHIELQSRLRRMTISSYADERLGFVQSVVRPLGVPLSKSMPYFEKFMAACLKAEMNYLGTFLDREGGQAGETPHPDTINGKWKGAADRITDEQVSRILGATKAAATKQAGKSLHDCLLQWQADRKRANKLASSHGIGEKELAITEFEQHANVRDIGDITRAHVVAYRDHLSSTGLKTPTFNKRVGQITTLLTTAKRAGWIDADITGGIYIEVPSGTNEREPFTIRELDVLFAHAVFRLGHRSKNIKAAGDLEFWLPLISMTGGLISSEIMQLGPDTIGPHPDFPEIICYQVSNAGGRAIKALSRKRYVPVRKELWDNGLSAVVNEAVTAKRRLIWKALAGKTSSNSKCAALHGFTLRSGLRCREAVWSRSGFA